MTQKGSFLSLPPELQQKIIKDLDPLDLRELLQATPQLAHLFQLVLDQEEPFFFLNVLSVIARVPFEDFDPLVHRALITLVDLSNPLDIDAESAVKSFSQTINFFAMDMKKYTRDDEEVFIKILTDVLPSSKLILVNADDIEVDVSLLPDPGRVTIKDSNKLSIYIDDPEPVGLFKLQNISHVQFTNLSVDLLTSLDLSMEPRSYLSVDKGNASTPSLRIINKTIAASTRIEFGSTSHIENVTLLSEHLHMYLSPCKDQDPPLLKSIKAPNAKRILIYTTQIIPKLEDVQFPVVEEIIADVGTDHSDDEEFGRFVGKLLKFPTMKKFTVTPPRSNVLFVRDGELLRNLEELRITVSSPGLSDITGKVKLPNLKALSMSLQSFEEAVPLPKIRAPNLKEIEVNWNLSPEDETEAMQLLALYSNLDKLKLRFYAKGSKIDISNSIRYLHKKLKSIFLWGTTVDVFTELDFPELEYLGFSGWSEKDHFSMSFSAPKLKDIHCIPVGAKAITVSGFPRLETIRKDQSMFEEITLCDLPVLTTVDLYCNTQKIKGSNLPKLKDFSFILPSDRIVEDIVDFSNVNTDVDFFPQEDFDWD